MQHTREAGHTHAGDEEIIVGVDTHKDTHVAAVITVQGVALANAEFPTTATGYRSLLAWARDFGVLHRAGVEGTGSYGAALTRYLRRHDVTVVEVNRPDRAARRRQGKTDAVDATAAAYAVLSTRATTTPKTGDGPVEMLRMFKLARTSAVKARTQAVNQLNAVIVGADPALRDTLGGLTTPALIRHCASLPDTAPHDVATATTYTLRRLARRIQELTAEERELQQQITAVIDAYAPHLLQRHGIGPDSAAALLITAGDNPDRMTSEGSFAALCGVNPIEASSGKTRRRRLNRGGDRRANAALYRIALTRTRSDQRTRDYLNRRATQGMTRREAIRCLKRYIAREIYQMIQQINPSTACFRTA
ncbi:IS110 family RNA-guided transposase [Catellatospora paridis]|uniref:IS110 family transposase n=1 Tax=Catellatospora paridis TaxID=1617086 RepID=UPI0012D4617A|nr:IS110 family transposase [Catellatospora paridis]